jgi:hypothetical protein
VIVGSLLLILVAVALLVAGVLSGSNALIICCMVLVVIAAIVLVMGVKQQAASSEESSYDDAEDEDEEKTGEYRRVADNGFRSRQSERRSAEVTTESVPVRSRRGAVVADDRATMVVDDPAGRSAYAAATAATTAIPAQSGYDQAPFEQAPFEPAPNEQPPYDQPYGYASAQNGYAANAAAYEAEASVYEGQVDLDEDPPDEPSAQIISPAAAARVAMLTSDVLVIDGRPRYHVTGCVHLLGRESEPLPVGEAVELGFTPCGMCEPDSALLAEARRV